MGYYRYDRFALSLLHGSRVIHALGHAQKVIIREPFHPSARASALERRSVPQEVLAEDMAYTMCALALFPKRSPLSGRNAVRGFHLLDPDAKRRQSV